MKTNTWVVVAGKDQTRIFDKFQQAKEWQKVTFVEREKLDKDHAFKTIGHLNSNSSGSHGAFDENGSHRKIYDHYFHAVAEFINKARATHQFEHLFLVASPETMGELKNKLDKETVKHLKKTINKDLVHLNQHELEEYMHDDFLFYGDLHK